MCLIGRRLKNTMTLAGLIDREEENEAFFPDREELPLTVQI